MKVVYKREAVRDIQKKQRYISDVLKNRAAAEKLTGEILHAVSRLSKHPRMGVPLNGKFDVDSDLRFLVVSEQLVFYRVEEDRCVSVVRILDGRQDYMQVLFEEPPES